MGTLIRIVLIAYCMTCCGKDDSASSSQTLPTTNTQAELNGHDGVNGKDGKDGTNGTAGKDGTNGKDATTIDINQWYDAITTKMWSMGATDVQIHGNATCSGNFRAPTVSELSDACFHGLFKVYVAKLGALPATTSWATTANDALTISTCLAATQANGTQAIIACIQK